MQNIPKNMFEPAAANAGDAEKISKKSLSLWKDAMLRFRSNKLACNGRAYHYRTYYPYGNFCADVLKV